MRLDTKEKIEEFLNSKNLVLIEYGGNIRGYAIVKDKNGNVKRLNRLDKLIDRLKNKKEYQEPNKPSSNRKEIIESLNYDFIKREGDKLTLRCRKHNIEFTTDKNNINEKRHNPYICPECKPLYLIERIEKDCPSLKVINELESDKNHRIFLLECRECGHTFKRYSTDIVCMGHKKCPNCKPYRYSERQNPFFKNFEEYSEYVRRLTELNMTRYSKYIKVSNELEVHLDHRFSISDGYDNHLPPWMVACPINLEYITGKENLEKHKKSSITLKELLGEFNKFLEVEESYLKLFNTP